MYIYIYIYVYIIASWVPWQFGVRGAVALKEREGEREREREPANMLGDVWAR